jgi:hypothetical protein
MKLKFAVPFLVLAASASALAAAQQSGSANTNAGFLNQQFNSMNNGTGVTAGTNWFNHIGVSGLMNLDAWSQSNGNYLGTDSTAKQPSRSGLAVSTLRLNLDAKVNSWVNGHVSLFYGGDQQPNGIDGNNSTSGSRYYRGQNSVNSGVDVDQAYVDIGNLAQSPFMLRVGKQYVPFGHYKLDAITPTLTQQLSETRGTAAQLALVTDSGFHGAIYGFKGPQQVKTGEAASNESDNINNGGASLGYTNLTGKVGFDLGAGYLYNMASVGDIYQHGGGTDGATVGQYNDRVGAWAGHATVMTGPFSLGIDYVSAIGKFNANDLAYTDNGGKATTGASPSAGTVTGTFAFKTYGYNSKLTGTYQWSKQAFDFVSGSATNQKLALPENRWGAEYDINVLQNTMVGFEFHHDTGYGTTSNAADKSSNTGTLRLSVLL